MCEHVVKTILTLHLSSLDVEQKISHKHHERVSVRGLKWKKKLVLRQKTIS